MTTTLGAAAAPLRCGDGGDGDEEEGTAARLIRMDGGDGRDGGECGEGGVVVVGSDGDDVRRNRDCHRDNKCAAFVSRMVGNVDNCFVLYVIPIFQLGPARKSPRDGYSGMTPCSLLCRIRVPGTAGYFCLI